MSSSKNTSSKTAGKNAPSKAATAKWRRMDIIVTVVAVVLIGYGVWSNFIVKPATDTTVCREPGSTETVSLDNDSFSQATIQLNRCDRLKVVNNDDDLVYEMALGTRSNHTPYPGFGMQGVRPGEYFEFDALKAGTFVMHDHLRDKAKLQIEISE